MKQKTFKKTLNLKKQTVSNLESNEMKGAKGGGASDFSYCYGYCIPTQAICPGYTLQCPTVTCKQYTCTCG